VEATNNDAAGVAPRSDAPDGDEEFFERAVRAATQVRRELPELAPGQAARLGGQLDRLLADLGGRQTPGRQQALDEVLDLLSSEPAAQQRLSELLAQGTVSRSLGDYAPIEGDPTSDYDRWLCPQCGYVFAMIDADIPQPDTCPNDGSALDRRLAGG
jgi:rubrerythrin